MKHINLILIAIVALLALAVSYFTLSNKKGSLEGYDFNFGIADTASIQSIYLFDRSGNKIELERVNAGEWNVNKNYKARFDAVKNLLDCIHDVTLQYRLPRNAVKNAVESLATSGIKVEIYNAKKEKIKCYYVGGTNADETATFFIMENAQEPYACHIPSFNGGLRIRYFTEEQDWRDRFLYSLRQDEIQSVEVNYPLQNDASFIIQRKGSDFVVSNMSAGGISKTISANAAAIENYLYNFKHLGIEGFENGHPQTDSIRRTMPFVVFKLETTDGKKSTLKLHPILKKNNDNEILLDDKKSPIIERYWGEWNESDLVMVQNHVFKKLFVRASNFVSKN